MGLFLAIFGPASLFHSLLVLGMAVAGVTLLLAGLVSSVRVGPLSLSWRHFVAVSYGVFGVLFPASLGLELRHGTATGIDIALFVTATAGALSLLFYGYDVLRDGHHFDIEADVERVVGG